MLELKIKILIDKMIFFGTMQTRLKYLDQNNVVGTQKESCSKEMVLKYLLCSNG